MPSVKLLMVEPLLVHRSVGPAGGDALLDRGTLPHQEGDRGQYAAALRLPHAGPQNFHFSHKSAVIFSLYPMIHAFFGMSPRQTSTTHFSYNLANLQVRILTGRSHQIRVRLAASSATSDSNSSKKSENPKVMKNASDAEGTAAAQPAAQQRQ